jgi:NAD(P)-dependent dehydrogenase (short-subunit alcohol dehydrogenase family)
VADLGYEGKTVAVTGAASGIGEATATLLGDLGARVIGLDRHPPRRPMARFVSFDLCDETSIADAAEEVGDPLDGLVHCAGLPQTAPGLDVYLAGFVGPRELTRSLLDRLGAGGAVTHVASTAAYAWRDNLPFISELLAQATYAGARDWCAANLGPPAQNYAVAKGAVSAFVAESSHELAGRGVRINCVSPGPTETPMTEAFRRTNPDDMARLALPMGRSAQPEEQAWVFAFLTSPRASFVTGSTLYVDGGYVAALTSGHITR